jgi:hypothetical protein
MTASPRPATLGAMKTPKKFRIRRSDLAPDDTLPAEPFESREAAERAAEKLFGADWREEYEVYGYTSGSTKTGPERAKGKNPLVTFTLPAEDLAYVNELAQREGRSKASVIREGIALVRKKNKD